MNTLETAKFTGISADLLVRMRYRPTSTLRSGPPYSKRYNRNGLLRIVYSKAEVKRWLKQKKFLITAGEAALALGVIRDDILSIRGVKRFDIKNGFIVIRHQKTFTYIVLKGVNMKYLTESEAAEILKVSTYTLARYRRKGESPPYIKVGSRIRYIEKTLHEWAQENQRKGA